MEGKLQNVKKQFFKLCDELHPHLEKKATIMQSPIDVEKQIGITLYYLSDEGIILIILHIDHIAEIILQLLMKPLQTSEGSAEIMIVRCWRLCLHLWIP